MPLIRYRIGDRARFPNAPAGCVYKLLEITGRTLEYITLPSGLVLHPTQFPHLLKDFDVREYQVIQQVDGSLDVFFVPGRAFDNGQRQDMGALLQRMISEVDINILEVERIQRTRSGKLRPVISHYDSSKET